MEKSRYRIEVYYTARDYRAEVVRQKCAGLGYAVDRVHISDNYLVNAPLSPGDAERVGRSLAQPVTQGYAVNTPWAPDAFDFAVEIGYLPGVTDNVAHTVRESVEDLLGRHLDIETAVFTTVTYFLAGRLAREDAERIGSELHNPLIQRMKVLDREEYGRQGGMGRDIPVVHIAEKPVADIVDLAVPADELARIAREGIANDDGSRRGPLALDMASMGVIVDYFRDRERRNPTDVELESIAQTWSEHCKHTIFAASLDEIREGIYRKYIKEATIRIRREKGERDFCVSVFEDNAGGIEFDRDFIVADKVETHNSPSALDPFGGSITGIVGVNRDAIGFGMASRPIANRYGFCFANPFDETPLYRSADPGSRLLPPRRIMEGVVHGVNAGGNTSGIPTPQGFVYFDDRYKGKPLVFVGTVGLIPKENGGRSLVHKKAIPGDCIVMAGGRVGRDGIHGATFSSEALNAGSPATAVQIGDPITQKKLSDAIVKEARDRGLYSSITDNGAGGLSCSVAEMARECGGFEVDLDLVPLKYPGLSPWQIWVSESQERMTLSVPKEKCDEFLSLMAKRGVEATVIGTFTDTGRGIVTSAGKTVFDLDLTFLHEGLPKKSLSSTYARPKHPEPDFPVPADLTAVFHDMLGRLNTASFEFISTQYDHEVQANSVIKPLQGKGQINGNASVIRPVLASNRGVVLSQALYPSYSDIDTYHMAACAIDTAVRNCVAAGGTLERLAILDNFCWCDSTNPERLGQLKEAARASYDYAVAYGTPFISGKDSMFNDFRGLDENFKPVQISIPPTLLISSIGIVEDIARCQTIDFKVAGDYVYLLGNTADETGGSEYYAYAGERITHAPCIGNRVPVVDAPLFLRLYRALEEALSRGIVASSMSLERGGLGIALAKSALAGMLGVTVDLAAVPRQSVERDDVLLYAESQGRVLVSVAPADAVAFEKLFAGLPFARIGEVNGGDRVVIRGLHAATAVDAGLESLYRVHKGRFAGF